MDTLADKAARDAAEDATDAASDAARLIEILQDDGLIVLPVRRMALFPGATIPIAVGRPRSIAAVELAVQAGQPLAVVMQKEADLGDPGLDDLHKVGTSAQVLRHMSAPDGTHHVIVQGEERVRLGKALTGLPCLAASYEPIEPSDVRNAAIDARRLQLKSRALEALGLLPGAPEELSQTVAAIHDPGQLADLVAQHLDLESSEKQEILETIDLQARLDRMLELLAYRIEVLRLSKDISRQTQETISAQQRQHILRQQLEAIRRELGETDGSGEELAALKTQIETVGMGDEAKTHALKEHARLERIPESSTEYAMLRSYLETLVDLPWSLDAPREIDLEEAERILDADHYGLERIKKRVLEFLAVRKLKPDGKSPILCFVGPPGVGKTSLGQSIARAMGRDFARLSLGGVHDESEIRGHRMTYVGAMPGNIIKTLQRAGARDCVFMLDEIDKLGTSLRGDPAAALLEVLDPVQNTAFRDAYLNLPFDLSKVVFVATANVLEAVPGPLRDRMEVIELSGYTPEEKREIAVRYLAPRQLEANGLGAEQCEVSSDAIDLIIERYTREAGVRNLEREIGAVVRAAAMRVARGETNKVSIDAAAVEDALGPGKFEREAALQAPAPGVATGLAWTPLGGDILFIEASLYPGSGKLTLTGQLGDVMRESAQAALSLVKRRAEDLGVNVRAFAEHDLHVHVPAGAIPKDGPSAGAAIFLAMVSAFNDACVRSDTAVTGEISLRGLILPVGGIKEKVIAADRAGLTRVLLPKRNQRDLDDIPQSARDRLQIVWIETVDDAIDAAFGPC